ncbi:Hypothetical protein A7982_04956 [Minicystis rosea]|nr:Hypothetical protein A7982_04956 [Minicystis rosea]
MVSTGWKAEAEALHEASRSFAAAAEAMDAAAVLEAAGRLVTMGAPAEVIAWAEGRADRGRSIAEAPARTGSFEAIEDAAVALHDLLERRALGKGDVTDEELSRGVREAFRARDQLELQRLGAATILGRAPELGAAEESALIVFESLVRPALFRLTELNDLRREALARIAPAHRATFWWWCEGADVAPHAVASLPAVAHLVARFPAAAEMLAALVAAQRTWDEAASERRVATVVSLRGWLRRRTDAARAATGAVVALAAATRDEEITLLDERDYQVSWSAPDTLVIDLVADRAPGAVPSLRRADGSVVASVSVAGAEERFAIHADETLLSAGRAVLVLPLAGGVVEIALPPNDRP